MVYCTYIVQMLRYYLLTDYGTLTPHAITPYHTSDIIRALINSWWTKVKISELFWAVLYTECFNNCHCLLLSSIGISLYLDKLLEWTRWLMPTELCLSNHHRTGEDHRDDRMQNKWRMASSCLKLEKQLRIGLSGGCWWGMVHGHIGLYTAVTPSFKTRSGLSVFREHLSSLL